MSNEPFLELAVDAIERRDAEAVEGLRARARPEHVAPLMETWRRSLPWPVKDLYVALLMDQRVASVEELMIDALEAPTVETRAYAVAYLSGSLASFGELLTPGGWVDEAKVAAAIIRWRAESGVPARGRSCPRCGAPLDHAAVRCRYCDVEVRPGAVATSGRAAPNPPSNRWQLRIGEPRSDEAPTLRRVTGDLTAPRVAMHLRALDGPFDAPVRLNVQIFRRRGAEVLVAAATVHDLVPPARDLHGVWTLDGPGEFDFRVVDPKSTELLASTRFRVR